MKKIIALLLAGVLCATAAYTAIAAEEDEETTAAEEVTTVEVETEESQIEDIVIALQNDEQAQEIANNIADSIKNGAAKEDVNELLVAFIDYLNGNGYDVADLKTNKVVNIMGTFLEDCGVDSEALGTAISDVKQVINNVKGTDDAAASADADAASADSSDFGGADSAADSAAESYAVYGVESTTIPDTGFEG